ncbi:MAG: hypothetical protein ACFFDW_15845, partial [Candidatus Thorarchaeota archaeon]
SDYILKNYQEEFLEFQEQVGKEATKEWINFYQTPATTLKRAYSTPNFDPETKHYAFKGDKLVGFLTSSIAPKSEDDIQRAYLEFPLVLKGHETAVDLLIEKGISTLKAKGVKKILARAAKEWKGTLDKANKWGFKYNKNLYIVMEAKLKDLNLKRSDNFEIVPYDHSKDFNQMVQIFNKKFGMELERAKANFETINQNKEDYPVHLILHRNNKIIGRSMVSRDQKDFSKYYLGTMVYENEEQMIALLAECINQLKKIKGAQLISQWLSDDILNQQELFSSLGFIQTAKIDYYEKEI